MSLILGDCIEVMAGMDPESVDAVVCDPPYGLEFMGKEWDRLWSTDKGRGEHAAASGRPSGKRGWDGMPPRPRYRAGPEAQAWHEAWAREALRVAKPSAYLLAFGGTRTVHRMTCAIEDAGWIVRDMLVWAYASGFPKSKASLKPAWEPIILARKPGPLRMLAIDECRIPTEGEPVIVRATEQSADLGTLSQGPRPVGEIASASPLGRWPSNVILTDPIFDGGVEGVVGGGETSSGSRSGAYAGSGAWSGEYGPVTRDVDGDSGTYSRFFILPKADRADREPVLGGLPTSVVNITEGHGRGPANTSKGDGTGIRENRPRANGHPTVKPTDLMRHLVRLVTPTGGIVLDPFLGSGTTAIAAEMEGFGWVGIEREAEYVAIAEARLNGVQRGLGLETA